MSGGNVCSVMSCPSPSLRSMSLRCTPIFLTVLMEQLYCVVVNTLLLPFVFPKYTCLPVLSPRWVAFASPCEQFPCQIHGTYIPVYSPYVLYDAVLEHFHVLTLHLRCLPSGSFSYQPMPHPTSRSLFSTVTWV